MRFTKFKPRNFQRISQRRLKCGIGNIQKIRYYFLVSLELKRNMVHIKIQKIKVYSGMNIPLLHNSPNEYCIFSITKIGMIELNF